VGYEIQQVINTEVPLFFVLKREHELSALAAIRNYIWEIAQTNLKELGESFCHIAFVDVQKAYHAQTLDECLAAWRWQTIRLGRRGAGGRGKPRHIVGLRFTGQKLGAEEVLFKLLAPFVESGSALTLRGEDGQVWTYLFEDARLKIVDTKTGEAIQRIVFWS
jgi:hypothetical protein